MYLITDMSSILAQLLHIPDEEYGVNITFEGNKYHIPSLETCIERAEEYFQNVIDKLNIDPQKIIAVVDPESTGAARKRKFPFYKANRPARPKVYYDVFNALVEHMCEYVMQSGGVKATPRVVPSVEADDLIFELCKRLPQTTIFSVDKDMLSAPATHHYIGGELDPVKFPVPADLILTYRAIVAGDASDNIPSCKGFGKVAWDNLLELVGPDGLYELKKMIEEKRLHELAEDVPHMKKLQLIVDQAETIYQAYECMSPLHVPAHKVKFEARCQECSQELVTAKNFKDVYRQVGTLIKVNDHSVIDYETDVPPESAAWLAGTKGDDGKGGIGVDVIASEITGMGLKIGPQAWYFSVDHADTDNISLDDLESILQLIKEKRCYSHNASFEETLTYNTFGYFLEEMWDTILMASYVNENDHKGLKHLSKRDLDYDQTSYAEVVGDRSGMREVTGEEVLAYGIDDVITCDALQNLYTVIMHYENTLDVFAEVEHYSQFFTHLAFIKGVNFDNAVYVQLRQTNDANIIRAETELENMLIALEFGEDVTYRPLTEMASKSSITKLFEAVTGKKFVCAARTVKGCVQHLLDNGFIEIAESVTSGTMNDLYKAHWRPRANLNVRSPTQVKELIYTTLGCPVRLRNKVTDIMRKKGVKEGNPSTDDEAIANAIAFGDVTGQGKEVLEKLLEYKGYLTRESLFLSKYPKVIHWKTKRIHGSMVQCGATTRRYTHSNPNWAQSSKRKGKEMRDVVVADENYSIVSLDFASQELKLQAEDCRCPEFLACYLGDSPRDIHAATGYQVAKMQGIDVGTYEEFEAKVKSGDKEAKKFRADGKGTNFASSYGCSNRRLAHMLAIHESTASLFLEAKARAFPGLIPYVDKYHKICQKRKYSTTFMGARRHLAKNYAMSKSDYDLSAVDRLAWSFRIQSSGAEMVKLALSRMWKDGVFNNDDVLPISVIHDEVVVQIKNSVLESMVPRIAKIVTAQYANMLIPMTTEPEVGKRFGSLKPFEG